MKSECPKRTSIEDDRNDDPTFQKMLSDYRLQRIDGNLHAGFSVQSCSGGKYRVTHHAVIANDGSMRFRWDCDCPARKRCRHIDACEQVSWVEESAEASETGDYCALEILENTLD